MKIIENILKEMGRLCGYILRQFTYLATRILSTIIFMAIMGSMYNMIRIGYTPAQIIGQYAKNSKEFIISLAPKKNISKEEEKKYKVVRVVDGDTIVIDLEGKEEKLRFIGIDTPESVHSDTTKNTEEGKIASEYTKNLLEGQEVSLKYDVQERDKYGRILAYVYLGEEMVNRKLLQEGYAQIYTFPPNVKNQKVFLKDQQKAQKEKKGFWKTYEN